MSSLAWRSRGALHWSMRGALVILAIDNQGVVGGLVKGTSSASDHNATVAHIWLDFAVNASAPWVIRVETDCNVADGPTREKLEELNLMQAHYIEPKWPPWVVDFWKMG